MTERNRQVSPREKTPAAATGDDSSHTGSVPSDVEREVGISVDDLAAAYILDGLKGFGPRKFKDLHLLRLTPASVAKDPKTFPFSGKTGDSLKAQLEAVTDPTRSLCRSRAIRQIGTAHKLKGRILTYGHPDYPALLLDSSYPTPLLYVRGAVEVLKNRRTVACVGSRKIRPPYSDLHAAFARRAAETGVAVVSGFALGADTIGHESAWKAGGQTICVMPGGLDRPFPPENKPLWESLLTYPGAIFVSEFPFGTRASSLNLKKRNKSIVAFACGVLISQTTAEGGAMNAYRFALEQRKPLATFADDGTDDCSGNRTISQVEKVPTHVFSSVDPNPEAYERWLQELLSLT